MLRLRRKTFVSIALVVFIAIFSTGCHTLANLEGKERILISAPGARRPQLYGGVIRCVEEIEEQVNDPYSVLRDAFFFQQALYLAFMTVDTSASAVADTVTIPIVLLQQKKWDTREWVQQLEQRDSRLISSEPPIPSREE